MYVVRTLNVISIIMRKGIVIKYIQKNYMGKELKLSLEKVQLNTKETVMQEMRDKTKNAIRLQKITNSKLTTEASIHQ